MSWGGSTDTALLSSLTTLAANGTPIDPVVRTHSVAYLRDLADRLEAGESMS